MPDFIPHIEDLINHGRYLEARAKTDEALLGVENLRLRQLYALSLSKSGAPEAARDYLEPFYKTNADDPETAGILGSIYKELFKKNQQTSFAILSRDTYLKNFATTKSYYTGINAASMSAMVMQSSKSKEIAKEVIELIRPDTEDFWELATLGEAYLLTKDKPKSVEYYLKARKAAGTDWGKITSAYNQLWLLNHLVPVSGEVMKIFTPPAVAAFVGHMIDHPDRKSPRFPKEIEVRVKDALAANIRTLNAKIGYCSLACGGDILFAEAMAEQGGEINIFIPFAINEFISTSVRFAGETWVNRFHTLLEKFPATLITTDSYFGLDDIFSFQSKIIFGSAILRSAVHHTQPYLLSVLSEVDLNRSEGGTRDTMRLWPFAQRNVNINPDLFLSTEKGSIETKPPRQVREKEVDRPVLFMVFADLLALKPIDKERLISKVNAKIEEEDIPLAAFVIDGDSILTAFEFETSAIEMVRLLLELMKEAGDGLALKIILHAGPVYRNERGIEGRDTKPLREISRFSPRAAICASGNMAAVLALNPEKFEMEYGGFVSSADGKSKHTVYKVTIKK